MNLPIQRPEARPLQFDMLSDGQWEGISRLIAIIQSSVDASERIRLEEGNAPCGFDYLELDLQRANSTVMIAGGRGTGKTSLLLTIQQLTQGYAGKKTFDDFAEVIRRRFPAGTPMHGEIHGLSDRVAAVRDRCIWLESLDFEPLPKDTDLLPAILARLDNRLNMFGLGTVSEDGTKTTRDFHLFCKQVSLGWTNAGRVGLNASDPDLAARELFRTERNRLSLRADFSRILAQLSRKTKWACSIEKPIFILPVDDLDLNPSRCLELLQLVRAIGSSHLLVVALGDLDIAQLAAELGFVQAFASISPTAIQLSSSPTSGESRTSGERSKNHRWRDWVHDLVPTLAHESIRKLIPPTQVIRLGAVTTEEAKAYRPEHFDDERSLGKLLSIVQLPGLWRLNYGTPTLANLMFEEKLQLLTVEYPARAAFQVTFRHLFSYWHEFHDFLKDFNVAKKKKTSGNQTQQNQQKVGALILALRRERDQVLAADMDLAPVYVGFSEGTLRRETSLRLELMPLTSSPQIVRVDAPYFPSLKFREYLGLSVRATDSATRLTAESSGRLVAGTVAFLHDLEIGLRLNHQRGTVSALRTSNTSLQIDAADHVSVNWSVPSETEEAINWAIPRYESVIDYHTHMTYWNALTAELSGQREEMSSEQANELLAIWLSIGVSVLSRRNGFFLKTDFVSDHEVPRFIDVEKISIEIAENAKQGLARPNSSSFRAWAPDLIASLAPECLANADLARPFFTANGFVETFLQPPDRESGPRLVQEIRAKRLAKCREPMLQVLFNPRAYENRVERRLRIASHWLYDLQLLIQGPTARVKSARTKSLDLMPNAAFYDRVLDLGKSIGDLVELFAFRNSSPDTKGDPSGYFLRALAVARTNCRQGLADIRMRIEVLGTTSSDNQLLGVERCFRSINQWLNELDKTLVILKTSLEHPINKRDDFCPALPPDPFDQLEFSRT